MKQRWLLSGAVPLVPSMGGMVLKLILSLVLVVGLILLLQRAARRWGGSLGAGRPGPEKIRILSQRPVGPRLSLAVVQVMDRTLLVGISPQGIRPVADLGNGPAGREGQDFTLVEAAGAIPPGGTPAEACVPKPARWGSLLSGLRRTGGSGGGSMSPIASTGGRPHRRPHHSEPSFEAELSRKLAALRERYPTLGEVEPRAEGNRP